MNRREYLAFVSVGIILSIAGCPQRTRSPDETGIIYQGEVNKLRGWPIEAVTGQSVTIEASEIQDGELLLVEIFEKRKDGDDQLIHTHQFFEKNTEYLHEYEFIRDGLYLVRLDPNRQEASHDVDVTVYVTIKVNDG